MREISPSRRENHNRPLMRLADGNSCLSPKSKMRSGGLIRVLNLHAAPCVEYWGWRLRWDGASCPQGTYAPPPILLWAEFSVGDFETAPTNCPNRVRASGAKDEAARGGHVLKRRPPDFLVTFQGNQRILALGKDVRGL